MVRQQTWRWSLRLEASIIYKRFLLAKTLSGLRLYRLLSRKERKDNKLFMQEVPELGLDA